MQVGSNIVSSNLCKVVQMQQKLFLFIYLLGFCEFYWIEQTSLPEHSCYYFTSNYFGLTRLWWPDCVI